MRRKRQTTKKKEGDDPEDEEEGGSTRAELKKFLNADKKLRTNTVTVTLDNILRCSSGDVSLNEEVKAILKRTSNSLGILQHLVSVYLNYLADLDPEFDAIFDIKYINQLFTRFARLEFDSSTDIVPDPYIEDYLKAHPIQADLLKDIQDGFMATPRDFLVHEKMAPAIKRHIEEGFEHRVTEHIICDLECRLWQRRNDPYFDNNLEKAAQCIFSSAVMNDEDVAIDNVHAFLEKERGQEKAVLHEDWFPVVNESTASTGMISIAS
jgi:hypothetical protein